MYDILIKIVKFERFNGKDWEDDYSIIIILRKGRKILFEYGYERIVMVKFVYNVNELEFVFVY